MPDGLSPSLALGGIDQLIPRIAPAARYVRRP